MDAPDQEMIAHLEVSRVIPIPVRSPQRRRHLQRSPAPVPRLATWKTSQYGVLKEPQMTRRDLGYSGNAPPHARAYCSLIRG